MTNRQPSGIGCFVILDRLRRTFAHAQSILMNRPTLLEHRGQWVMGDAPTYRPLRTLAPDEADVYGSLVGGDFGPNVRLEQERVRFHLFEDALNELR
ncbi:Wadjet anti-phage system protein JetD domain-containing protein [Streptomyces mirabilis]|uniref:Wadjet anti-phage system protein JetD domain-containing protein n=1 Tax=Streptomyces mirabilis TaxID=68239 RepID=UPI003650FF1B